MKRIAVYEMPRKKALLLGALVGVGLGFLNTALDIQLVSSVTGKDGATTVFNYIIPLFTLTGQIVGALALTIVLHEGIHGAVAAVFGYRPRFGIKPPLIYITFEVKVPRGVFILVALAPLIILDGIFLTFTLTQILPAFFYICFMVNSVGSVGDAWITAKLIPRPRGSMVQDTKTGIEVWEAEEDVIKNSKPN